jgi:metallo-beta-lactamase family protein
MQIKLRFLGAAQNVTGSRYLVETNGTRILVDCGLYQERDLRARNWDPFPVPPNTIDTVLLTHAHIDHCGLLPKLVREGFSGEIYCTEATAEIAQIALVDSAHLQEEDAEFKRKRHEREGRRGRYPEMPLYSVEDVEAVFPLISPVEYEEEVHISNGINASFHDAGHILGSSMIKLEVSQNRGRSTILFSGDVGRWDKPILRDPTSFEEADYVLVESTYGDRIHSDSMNADDILCQVVNSTQKAGGNIVIPSFAIGRTQEILYTLNELLVEDRIPHLIVFLDSPMAIGVTEVFEHHPELLDEETTEHVRRGESPFEFPNLSKTRTAEQSKAINHIRGTAVIIAGSGMCTGGRIKHHLVHNISRPESTILFVGYQAYGTLGRQIVDGAKDVRILGQMHSVEAKVARIDGFSAHADRDELLRWLSALKKPPRRVFVTHGEPTVAHHFADLLAERKGWEVSVPKYQNEISLDSSGQPS